jgi:hypothetical protein
MTVESTVMLESDATVPDANAMRLASIVTLDADVIAKAPNAYRVPADVILLDAATSNAPRLTP